MTALAVTVFEPGEIIWTGAVAAVIVGLVFAALPPTRTPRRIAAAAAGTFLGWLAWNFTLHVTHAQGMDTDAPVIALSWQDAGSGILTFVFVVLFLGLWIDRTLAASKVVAMAAAAGVTAAVFDIFVL